MIFFLEQQFEIYLYEIALFRNTSTGQLYNDYITAYIAGALTQILVHWFQQSFDLSIDELSRLTEKTILGKSISYLGFTSPEHTGL